ncbi:MULTISPECIES: integrase [unclassified Streptomyces]|uniref:integrase n=1 Tax=unclassified Streptomyces TaxID=2593676 RepID=UPI0038021F5A
MLAADIDIKIVSDTLGHSDTRATRDIYQSVLPQVGKSAAEATGKLVLSAESPRPRRWRARPRRRRRPSRPGEGKKKATRRTPKK